MAYNPGIVDRSGDILARGRVAGGMAALGGISQGFETYQKNKLQNQILSSENEALIAGLQQLQQMNVPGVSQMAPPGMDKLIQKHLEGGGLNLNDSMKLNAMLGTTLKTAKTTQDMQAQAVQRQLQDQTLRAQIAEGKQAASDVEGLAAILKDLQNQGQFTQEGFIAAASKAKISPRAMEAVGSTLKGLTPKARPNVYDTPQAALADIARLKAENKIPEGVIPVVKAEGGGYVFETIGAPTPPPGVESAYEQLGAKSAQASLDAYKQSFADAARAGQSGRLVVSALDKGATTGLFAPFKTIGLKILSEAAPGIKPELFEQELATKGIAALQAYGATGLAKGLGSMSNADREFFVALFPSITDTKQLNRFYALMAAENEKFANEDRKFVRELEEKGVRQDKILRELEARIEGRNVAQSIYEKVTGGTASNFKVGDQVKQGGKTYEWSGSNWAEVK